MKQPENRKLLFLDIDDTLLNHAKEVTPDVADALAAATDAGHRIIICTGRPLAGTLPILDRLPLPKENCYVICYNGALIYDLTAKKPIFHKGLPIEDARYILDKADEAGIHAQVYGEHEVLARRETEELRFYCGRINMDWRIDPGLPDTLEEDTIKTLLIDLKDRSRLERFRDEIADWARGRITVFFSNDYFLEFVREGISKGAAVRYMADFFGIPMENTVSAGDSENDITMIEAAHVGCAMANAHPGVKAVADYVTERDCENGGVAEIIERFILS